MLNSKMQHEEEAAVHLWNFVIPSQLPKLSQYVFFAYLGSNT